MKSRKNLSFFEFATSSHNHSFASPPLLLFTICFVFSFLSPTFRPRIFDSTSGEVTPQMVALLSGLKNKNLYNCGKLVLTGDMSELSITTVDLRNMNTLEGTFIDELSWWRCQWWLFVRISFE